MNDSSSDSDDDLEFQLACAISQTNERREREEMVAFEIARALSEIQVPENLQKHENYINQNVIYTGRDLRPHQRHIRVSKSIVGGHENEVISRTEPVVKLNERLAASEKEFSIEDSSSNNEFFNRKTLDLSVDQKNSIVNHLTSVVEKELLSMLAKREEPQTSSDLRRSENDVSPFRAESTRPVPKPRDSSKIMTSGKPIKDSTEHGRESTPLRFEPRTSKTLPNEQALIQNVRKSNESTQTTGENTEIEGSKVSNMINAFERMKRNQNQSWRENPKPLSISQIRRLNENRIQPFRVRNETNEGGAPKNVRIDPAVRKNLNGFECAICTETHSISDSKSFGCSHLFCRECLIEYLSHLINEGRLDSLKCPHPKCDSIASEQLIKQLLPTQLIQRYMKLHLKRAVETMDDIFYCPKCNDPVECDISVALGECINCCFNFCTSCLKPFHGTSDCNSDEKELLRVYMQQQNVQREVKARELLVAEQKRKELERIKQMRIYEENRSNSFIDKAFKRCPGCRSNIEKDGHGCNHMTCSKCNTEFCWLCLVKLNGNHDMEMHFSKCVLFAHGFVVD